MQFYSIYMLLAIFFFNPSENTCLLPAWCSYGIYQHCPTAETNQPNLDPPGVCLA